MSNEGPREAMPELPRGATWHAIWVMPLLVLLAVVFVPWSDEPSPVFDSVKMKKAAERWAAATGRRLPGSAPAASASAPASGALDADRTGVVSVRIVPASKP